MTQLMEPTSSDLSNLKRLQKQDAAGGSPDWLTDLRRRGMARFNEVGFPTTKLEEWRFTNVAPIAKTGFRLATPDDNMGSRHTVEQYTFGKAASAELVFVNGHYRPDLSNLGDLPKGARLMSLPEAIESNEEVVQAHLGQYVDINANAFVALNTGFLRDGVVLHVAKNVTVEGPIHLLFVSTGAHDGIAPIVSHPRVLVVAEQNSELTLVKSFVGTPGLHWCNPVTEVYAAQDARVDHYKLQHDSGDAFHVSTLQVKLERDSQFVSHTATIGGRLTRNDHNVSLAGQGSTATLNGLVLIGGEDHCDNHTLLDHAAPNCPSHELFKHVLDGKATAIFKGKILVRNAAQKTDSKQQSKSLLLSDGATMESMPALEIYADDVKCTHGSTTGPVDEEQVFYLRSRGVSLAAARHLMTYAFAADVTRRIKVTPVRERLESFMAAQHGLPVDLRITDLGEHDEGVLNM
ncbi:Fe-S cluster assembly protein SufD [Humisphaera borealis]|uniref:Fe-S cluster assembly protein SufD n=1 Tax=Humisphaera borealis TaxID=2807512 RepID=A0A7M2WQD2_9BACT|nr:Fe-S cluster assembly protein SufD [Humisphaera borealis]QOV87452.1 Fe-S cluster assembly protein SufD [Humisphaera borealis]